MARKTKEEAERTRCAIIEAARRVFLHTGVTRASLERIAAEAGVTRGAVYWHFQDKAELFFAMREAVFQPLIAEMDALLFSEHFDNALEAIEAALRAFFAALDANAVVREVFEIVMLRCEFVEAFAPVQGELSRPSRLFLSKLEQVYEAAVRCGHLRADLSAEAAAHDTWAFTDGLLHLLYVCAPDSGLRERVPGMIRAHMALRQR